MAVERSFFDTNVLIYAFAGADQRSERAEALLAQGGVIGVQTLNEFVSVATRKLALSWTDVLDALAAIRTLCSAPVPLTVETHEEALRIASRYGYRIYDSLVIAAALKASCNVLYSEDMHDRQRIQGLTILNPFRLH